MPGRVFPWLVVLLVWVVKDQWSYRVKTKNPLVEALKSYAIRTVRRNPIWVMRMVPKVMRALRWVKWGLPFWNAYRRRISNPGLSRAL